jgi:outer membrane immunogenic protein
MKTWLRGGVAMVATWSALSAHAADLTPVYKAPPPIAESPWSGFYAGLGLGFRASDTDATTTSFTVISANTFNLNGFATSEPLSGVGFRAAPYIGWNWQVAPQWVVGIEGDVGFANQRTVLSGFSFGPFGAVGAFGPVADNLALKTTWDASARGRAGFLVTPATLVYATGGAAWQHFDVISTCTSACTPGNFAPAIVSNSASKTGWTVGGGVETALWGHWFVRGEYRFADFGASSVTVARTSPNPLSPSSFVADTFNLALRTHTATFGFAYKFGDPVATANSVASPSLVPVKALPALASSWAGPYLGLGLGPRSSRTDATTTSVTIAGAGAPENLTGQATSQPLDGTAFRAAPYFGWNWQVAPPWVVGLEGDAGLANQTTTLQGFHFAPIQFSGQATDSLALKTRWDASARGRVGFLVTPTTLLYATGGAAWQRFDVISTCASTFACTPSAFTPVVVTSSTTKAGWTIGGGIESALWRNWFVRAEYRYADFGGSTVTIARTANSANAGNTQTDNLNVSLRTHTATFGLAYKFDWGTAPLVAKY